jgi:uncharacterized protein YkwD
MRSPARRPVPLLLALLLVVGLAPAAAVMAAEDVSSDAITAAERTVLSLTNKRRADKGLRPLRADTRMFALARERARYMAETERFSHTQADGTNVFDLMTDAGIKWYGGGEIIAWNTASILDYSASFAVKSWMDSSGHRAIIMSSNYNYVGFGLAISPTSGKRYWAGVYLKGPDRTGGWTKILSASKKTVDAKWSRVTFAWSGGDVKLQVLTSGFRYFQVQVRRDGGGWQTYPTTTKKTFARTWARGHTYEFRVRARDKAGNWGSWKSTTVRI